MTSPFALLLSIAGTVCMFILALIGIIADATIAPTPAVGAAHGPQHRRGRRPGCQPRRPRPLYGRSGVRQPAAPLREAAERDDGSTP